MKDLKSSTSMNAIAPSEDRSKKDLYCDARDYEPDLRWNYAAKGILCREETSVLYGPSNCGKSAVVCHLGHCIVTGAPFFGSKVTKGMVIHVCAEAPKSVQERVYAYRHDDTAAPYLIRRVGVDLSSPEDVGNFLDEVEELKKTSDYEVVLIIFDTLARSIGALDENCSSSMTGIAETAENIAAETGAHVMLIHHTGKDADRGGRGSSALRGAVFTELSLTPDGTVVVLGQEKQRTMAKALPVQFKTLPVLLGKDEDGEDRTTVHIVELEGNVVSTRKPTRGKEPSGCDIAVLTALHIRRMMGKRSLEPFRPRDILGTLPSEILGNVAIDSQMKRVSRALEKLADRPQPLVEKTAYGWSLVPVAGPGTAEKN